jgi:HAD superfamily hydrolase (TIGR01509 family)
MQRRTDVRVDRALEALRTRGVIFQRDAVARAFSAAGDELSRIHADGLDISAEARTILYLRHVDPDIAGSLDDDGWRAMHDAILGAALELRPELIPGAQPALSGTKSRGLPTALVSNAGATPGFVLRAILEDFEVLQYLDHTIFSDEVELSKPSPGIFECALEALGVPPDDAVFVGDQPILDVLGPRNAGLWSIQVGDVYEDGIEPHVRIKAIDELPGALAAVEDLMESSIAAGGAG